MSVKKKITGALQKKSARLRHTLLLKECAKLDPKVEIAMAEEGFREDMKIWPEY
jgi:hypothetical protein